MVGEAAEAAAALLPSCERGFLTKFPFASPSCLKEVISVVKKQQLTPGALVTHLGLRREDRARCGCCGGCWWPRGGGSPVSALGHSLAARAGVCAPRRLSLLGCS